MLPEILELLEKLSSQRQELLDILRNLSEEEAERHPFGEWSAKQQAAHLLHAEPIWLQWAQAVQDTPGITVGQSPEDNQPFTTGVEDADAKPMGWWLKQLRNNSMNTIECVRNMGISNQQLLSRAGTHRTFGEMNVLQLLRGIYRHDRMHMEQILGLEQSFIPKESTGNSN
ncbi:DinB family protein [Dehalococcoidia bacterium]|nr:DinB family protein [Dehalococcoidia bacterium]MCL0044008.1 DinB family protein [Dehalococcoidia bacterium]